MATQSSLAIRAQPFRCQPCHFRKRSEICFPHQTIYTHTTSIKASAADHNEPIEFKVEKLKDAMSTSSPVQEFPERKVQSTLLDTLQFLVQGALKWLLFSYFINNFLFDVLYSFFTTVNSTIPIGLLSGCLVAHILKDMSLEIGRRQSEDSQENDLKWRRLAMCGFFVLVQFTTKWLPAERREYIRHVGNGGLMQVLWYWRNFLGDAKK